jgi:hypothetical protein
LDLDTTVSPSLHFFDRKLYLGRVVGVVLLVAAAPVEVAVGGPPPVTVFFLPPGLCRVHFLRSCLLALRRG